MRPAPAGVLTEVHSTDTKVNVYIEYDAASLVALGLTADPACDGVMLRHGDPEDVLASTNRANPLAGAWLADISAPGDTIVSWSGTLAEDLFEPHPMTFLGTGFEALTRFCKEVGPQLEASGKSICFQPHCRHVLNDPRSCLKFHQEKQGPFEFALSPGDLIESEMLPDLEDHLTRAFEMLGEHCAMVILHDVTGTTAIGAVEESCRIGLLGQGEMPREHVRELLDACVPAETPIVISAGDIEAQLDWLGT